MLWRLHRFGIDRRHDLANIHINPAVRYECMGGRIQERNNNDEL